MPSFNEIAKRLYWRLYPAKKHRASESDADSALDGNSVIALTEAYIADAGGRGTENGSVLT